MASAKLNEIMQLIDNSQPSILNTSNHSHAKLSINNITIQFLSHK